MNVRQSRPGFIRGLLLEALGLVALLAIFFGLILIVDAITASLPVAAF